MASVLTRHDSQASIPAMPSQALPIRMRATSRVERARLLMMVEHYKVELGAAIKRRREELGMTQGELAAATHYKEAQTVSRWERGLNAPGDLEVVARALNWTLPELVAGIQPPNGRAARYLGLVPDEPPAQTPDLSAKPDLEAQLAALTRMVSELSAQLHDMQAAQGAASASVVEVMRLLDDRLPPIRESQRRRQQ